MRVYIYTGKVFRLLLFCGELVGFIGRLGPSSTSQIHLKKLITAKGSQFKGSLRRRLTDSAIVRSGTTTILLSKRKRRRDAYARTRVCSSHLKAAPPSWRYHNNHYHYYSIALRHIYFLLSLFAVW